MVWTSPEAIHLQINRVDVFAVNRDHLGKQASATDYCGGIARVVVHVGGQPFAPGGKSFRQRLSLANAECVIEGDGLQVQCFVSANADVLVMEVDDRRASPEPLKVTVSMLREPEVIAGENIATSVFSENQNRIVLTQRFRERDYHNASAVAVDVVGNKAEIVKTSVINRTLASFGDVGTREGVVPVRLPVACHHRTSQRAVQLDQSCRFVRKRTGGSGVVALPAHRRSRVAADARLSAPTRHGRVLPAFGEEGIGRALSSHRNPCP